MEIKIVKKAMRTRLTVVVVDERRSQNGRRVELDGLGIIFELESLVALNPLLMSNFCRFSFEIWSCHLVRHLGIHFMYVR